MKLIFFAVLTALAPLADKSTFSHCFFVAVNDDDGRGDFRQERHPHFPQIVAHLTLPRLPGSGKTPAPSSSTCWAKGRFAIVLAIETINPFCGEFNPLSELVLIKRGCGISFAPRQSVRCNRIVEIYNPFEYVPFSAV